MANSPFRRRRRRRRRRRSRKRRRRRGERYLAGPTQRAGQLQVVTAAEHGRGGLQAIRREERRRREVAEHLLLVLDVAAQVDFESRT
jgi:hypothetical protein